MLPGKGVIMSRQFDQFAEERQKKENLALVSAIEFGLAKGVAHAGGILDGYSVRCSNGASLLTIRATLAGRPQVAFVGAATPANAFRKAVREAYNDKLAWRQDKFST